MNKFSSWLGTLTGKRAASPPAPPSTATDSPSAEIMQIIRPDAQDRWRSLATRNLTPQRVVEILSGAAAGNLLAQHELFDLMEDTWPRLAKNLNQVKDTVREADRMVMPYSAKGRKTVSALAQDKADFLEQVIYDFRPCVELEESSFEDGLKDILDAFGKGLSVTEILWERRADGDLAGCIAPRAFNWVPPRYYGYDLLVPQLRLAPDGMQTNWQDFPPGQFIIGKFKTKTGHSSSAALLRKLAPSWMEANFARDWLLNFAQLFGVPIRWATYDRNLKPADIKKICEMLANMGHNTWGAFPSGVTLELKEAVQRAADNPQAFLLGLADITADILILGQTLTTDVAKSGSRALGEVHEGVETRVIDHAAGWAMDTLNYQFVPALMRFNFGNNDEDPYLEAKSIRPRDAKGMVERDKILFVDMGLPVAKQYLHERHGVPQPADGDELFIPPTAKSPMPNPDKLQAKAAPAVPGEKLLQHVMEDLTGVSADWLRPVAPVFAALIAKARDGSVSDSELLDAVEKAAAKMPELFPDLQRSAEGLRGLLVNAMGAAVVNGSQLAGGGQ